MTLEEAKEELLSILSSWQLGEIGDPWHVQDDAERIEEQLMEAKLLQPQNEFSGLAAQVDAVLNQLTNAQQQSVLPQDAGAMTELLEATTQNIQNALNKHSEYWKSITYETRKATVNEYWFGAHNK